MSSIGITFIVLTAALIALRKPWIGVLLWTWISLMSTHGGHCRRLYPAGSALHA